MTGGLVLALSLLQQITVVGIRIAIGVGRLGYGLLGLMLTVPAIRSRQLSWTAAVRRFGAKGTQSTQTGSGYSPRRACLRRAMTTG